MIFEKNLERLEARLKNLESIQDKGNYNFPIVLGEEITSVRIEIAFLKKVIAEKKNQPKENT